MAETQTPQTQAPALPADAGKEIGASGTFLFQGFISAEEYNRQLVGKYGLQVFDTMRRSDATVHAVLMVCKNPIIGAKWDIEAASDEDADVETADFIKRELFERKIMWPDVVRESLSCLDFGHSVFEKVLEPCDFNGKPRIGIAKLASRKQRSIMRWETSDHKPGITQIVPVTDDGKGPEIDIPRDKLIYVINEREGQNFEGISLLRFAYKPWKVKDALEIMHAIALERMSLGIPVVKKGIGNATADENELTKVRNALRQLRNNEESYLEIPGSLDISFLDMKANSTKDVLPTIQYQDRQITLSVLAQFLELGSSGGSSGSRAVSADHSTLFIKSLDAVARAVQQPFQQELVNYLVDLNYSNLPNGYPKLVYSGVDDEDSKAISDSVSNLMGAGALTADPEMENRLRGLLNLPQLPETVYDRLTKELENPPDPVINVIDPTAIDPKTGKPMPPKAQPAGPPSKNNKQNLKDIKDAPADTKKTSPTVASVIAEARQTQAKLLEVILEDE